MEMNYCLLVLALTEECERHIPWANKGPCVGMQIVSCLESQELKHLEGEEQNFSEVRQNKYLAGCKVVIVYCCKINNLWRRTRWL